VIESPDCTVDVGVGVVALFVVVVVVDGGGVVVVVGADAVAVDDSSVAKFVDELLLTNNDLDPLIAAC
jgi:hypothetical protein